MSQKNMTNADYQKRLSEILSDPDLSMLLTSTNDGIRRRAIRRISKNITALCRDVCGEVVGNILAQHSPATRELIIEQRLREEAILGQPQEESNASS